MTDATNTPESDEPPVPDLTDNEWALLTDLNLRDGRVQLLKRSEERYGFSEDDLVEVILVTDEETINIGVQPITQKRRITIPIHVREAYDLDNEYYDVWLRDTGRTDT